MPAARSIWRSSSNGGCRSLIGVIAGSVTARYAPERLFKIVFVAVAWSAAARLLLARATLEIRRRLAAGTADEDLWLLRSGCFPP